MLKAIEKALLLQKFDLFSFASVDHLMQLSEICREEVFKAGDTIFRRGEPAARLYLLVLGRAAFEGSEGRLLQETALNLWSCLAGVEHPATCRCAEDCTVLTLPAEDLLDMLAGEPELTLALLKYVARLHQANIE